MLTKSDLTYLKDPENAAYMILVLQTHIIELEELVERVIRVNDLRETER